MRHPPPECQPFFHLTAYCGKSIYQSPALTALSCPTSIPVLQTRSYQLPLIYQSQDSYHLYRCSHSCTDRRHIPCSRQSSSEPHRLPQSHVFPMLPLQTPRSQSTCSFSGTSINNYNLHISFLLSLFIYIYIFNFFLMDVFLRIFPYENSNALFSYHLKFPHLIYKMKLFL